MSAGHTKGPWEAGQYGNSFIVTAKARMYDVAVVRNIGNENNEANARLIAAAPDLLAACQSAMNGESGWAARIHSAVAKATGSGFTVGESNRG